MFALSRHLIYSRFSVYYNPPMPLRLDSILADDGPIARRLPGFESRPQQLKMAAAVDRTMAERGRLLVEAGTGVGKSFAYLLPAIKRIVDHKERVVVATNTINLQEQLADKDIPLLNAVIPDEFSTVLVKGRGNYLSLRRLKLASERQDRLFGDDEHRRSLHIIEDWAYSTRDGTLATLPQLPRPSVWDYAQSDSHNCMGRKCPTYDKCFYQQSRRRMENGDLLICNHALFFSDLALRMRGVGFLPAYDHVILDEAHQVEDVAAEHFGLSLTQSRVEHLLRLLFQYRTHRGFLTSLKLKDDSHEPIDRAIGTVLRCGEAADRFFESLIAWQKESGSANGRIGEPDVVENPMTPAFRELSGQLKFLRERLADHGGAEADEYELTSYARRAADIATETSLLVSQDIEGCVYWIEGTEGHAAIARRGRRPRIALKCVPIDIAPILQERLFGQNCSVVMTSATLATTGPAEVDPDDWQDDHGNDADPGFRHIISRLGCDGAQTLALGSPFDFALQMKVIVDRSMPEPSASGDSRRHIEQLASRVLQHLDETGGGAFVLFTSFTMLGKVADLLRDDLAGRGCPVLVHGRDGPPGLLLNRFREHDNAVLFGTASFWQGVDVRGRGLRNVIITRLPFDVPDRPLIQARHEHIRKLGGNPFMDDSVPRAIIRFKQGVGRLIRSHTDEGRIVILDPRIATKRYGHLFRNALPDGAAVEVVSHADS